MRMNLYHPACSRKGVKRQTKTRMPMAMHFSPWPETPLVRLTNEQLKRRVLERFIFGLREPVGSRVRIQLPKSYNEALMLATVIESEFSRTRIHAVEQLKSREMARPRFQGRVPTVRNINEKKFYPGRRPHNRQPNVHNVDTSEQRRCYRCQKIGHLARACSQKPEFRPRPNNDTKPTDSQRPLNFQKGSHAQK